MKINKKVNLILSKSKIKYWTIFAIFAIILTFTSCSKDCDCENNSAKDHPTLKVVNLNSDGRIITSVKLVGYEFTNLDIKEGDSQSFALDNGMQGGYSDINIIVEYNRFQTINKKINFINGQITTITLKGCVSYEGCKGIYLE